MGGIENGQQWYGCVCHAKQGGVVQTLLQGHCFYTVLQLLLAQYMMRFKAVIPNQGYHIGYRFKSLPRKDFALTDKTVLKIY